jgi:hypothetical protein
MSIAAGHHGPGRGADLLLVHCEALETDHARRAPVVARLHCRIGPELTRLLLAALTGDYRVRSRLTV